MQDLNDKAAGSSLSASEWNQVTSEIQNVIESLGIALSGADLDQLGKAIAGYVANGDFYTDSGSSNAYVLTPVGLKKSPPAYTNGSIIRFYAGNSNSGASTVNVGGLGVVSLKTEADANLPALSIVAGRLYQAIYYAAGGWYRLISVSASVAPELHSISASVAANALTISIPPQFIEFRNSSLTSGLSSLRQVGSTISMTVSSGSTLGTVNAVQSRLAVLAIDNAGTVELAVVNLAGGNNLDETTLISTTAEGGAGGADSASTIYSTTARANVPFRVVGIIESTQATAGTWATSPSLVQGFGGNVIVESQNYRCRAWVNFNGTGTVAIRASGNVISITDNGVGEYVVNFISPMSDLNYAIEVTAGEVNQAGASAFACNGNVSTTSAAQIHLRSVGTSPAGVDSTNVHAHFTR